MTQAVAAWEPGPPAGRRRWLFPALLLGGSLATAAAAIAGNGDIAVAVLPLAAAAVLGAAWFMPLRVTLLGLVFLGLGLDGDGTSSSPVAPLGNLLNFANLNKFVPIEMLAVPLMTLLLGYVLVIYLHRRLSLSRIDEAHVGFASPMRLAVAVSVLAIFAECANGYRHGGDLQMAKIQVQDFVLVLLVACLLAASLRGLRDYRVLGRVILAAACSKALMALWVFYTVTPRPYVATSHGDSLLFACATVMLIARFAEHPVRRNAALCLVFLPLLVGAMIANNRRLVWVQVAATLGTLYFISGRTRLKRGLTRAVLAASPLLVAYVAVGWNSDATLFAPVKVFRSVGDSDVDGSTLFRDLENYNLLLTMRENPMIGAGFGQQFNEKVTTADISFFREYRYLPHNSVLGLWGFTGLIGFTGLFMAPVVGVLFAARSYYLSRVPDQRAAAFTALGMVLIYLIHCYGDIGFSERESIFLVGSALGVAGQLALTTGAWRAGPSTPSVVSGRR